MVIRFSCKYSLWEYQASFEEKPMYLTQELIAKKRDGVALGADEIAAFVQGVTAQTVSDAQIAAFAMAVWFRGMDLGELKALTIAMRDSGEILRWRELGGPVLDKHSTGGVGDLVSLVLGPVVAACGGFVPMISGRGLGHTGGTLDKLASIPGFSTSIAIDQFQRLVQTNGIAIIGQSEKLAPADRRFYAVRDITATVNSVPLIVASILSKKLAEGLDALVMDIKLGSGAFMREHVEARKLAKELCRVATDAGLPCNALITDMHAPLAWSAGNALEVREAIEFLTGRPRHERLHGVVEALASEMLVLGGVAASRPEGKDRVQKSLDSGEAAERFARMVASQGGPLDLLDRPGKHLPSATISRPVFPDSPGFVTNMDTQSIGYVVVHLGGGRQRVEDDIDPAVGLADLCTPGQQLDVDTPLATIHASCESDWQKAAARLKSAIQMDKSTSGAQPVIYERIDGVQLS
jgi:thymidine phosphorylase